jgi:hypothetical protein
MRISYNEYSETYFVCTGSGSGIRYLNNMLEIESYSASERCKFYSREEAETAMENREHLDKLGENRI